MKIITINKSEFSRKTFRRLVFHQNVKKRKKEEGLRGKNYVFVKEIYSTWLLWLVKIITEDKRKSRRPYLDQKKNLLAKSHELATQNGECF